MKLKGACVAIFAIIATSCSAIDSTNVQSFINSYLEFHSERNATGKLDRSLVVKFIADSYYGTGGELPPRTFVIKYPVKILSSEISHGIIDTKQEGRKNGRPVIVNIYGDMVLCKVQVIIVGEVKDSKVVPMSEARKFVIDLLQTQDGLKVNGDSSQNNKYVFEKDLPVLLERLKSEREKAP